MTHICVRKQTIIGSDNGLSPDRRQAIIWTNAGLLLIGPLGTNFSEILIEILTFSFKKMRLKVSSAKRRPFCLGLNVLCHQQPMTNNYSSHRDVLYDYLTKRLEVNVTKPHWWLVNILNKCWPGFVSDVIWQHMYTCTHTQTTPHHTTHTLTHYCWSPYNQ